MNESCEKYDYGSTMYNNCKKNSTLFYWTVKVMGLPCFQRGPKCIRHLYKK
jgi:hypothetical protein